MADVNITIEGEVWKNVVGYEGFYQVSNLGRVYSVRTDKILKTALSNVGYVKLNIKINGVGKNLEAHRLVAMAFLPNPQNKPQVNHKDGSKINNRVNNLEWATAKENNNHAVATGLNPNPVVLKTIAKKGAENSRSRPVFAYNRNATLIHQFGFLAEAVAKLKISCATTARLRKENVIYVPKKELLLSSQPITAEQIKRFFEGN